MLDYFITQQLDTADAEIRIYIVSNTIGSSSSNAINYAGAYIPLPSPKIVNSLPPAPDGTKRIPTVVDGVIYHPLVVNCPAASCTTGDVVAEAIPDNGTQAYLEAVAKKIDKDINIATAVIGVGGSIIRGIGALGDVAGAAAVSLSKVVIPSGFANIEEFTSFGESLRSNLNLAGYTDVVPILQGSAVTGKSFKAGELFDVGRTSDFDVALASPELLKRAEKLGIGLRSEGVRTGPLSVDDLKALGLTDMAKKMGQQAGRDVNFMIYDSPENAFRRAPSLALPRN